MPVLQFGCVHASQIKASMGYGGAEADEAIPVTTKADGTQVFKYIDENGQEVSALLTRFLSG